jgi:hypothetical protein
VWAGTSRRCRGHSIFRAATIRTVGKPDHARPPQFGKWKKIACVGFSPIRASGNDDDYDVPADGAVVGHIMKANAAPVDEPWLWTPIEPDLKGCGWLDRFRGP